MDGKEKLRREIKAALSCLKQDEREHFSKDLVERIRVSTLWQDCDALFAYYPFNGEVDIIPLLKETLENKILALPLIDQGEIRFFRIIDLDHLRINRWGIHEPAKDAPPVNPDNFRAPLMLVPGLAFTGGGKRLGRGRGYYDRYLSHHEKLESMGVAYPFQIYKDLPTEPHDVLLKGIY